MNKVITIKKVKTKTAIAVALVCLAAGTAMAGLYYYGYRSIGSFNPFSKKESSSVATTGNKSNSQTASLIGTIPGICQVCGGKTYCKCECPAKTDPKKETPPTTPPSSGNVDLALTTIPGMIGSAFEAGMTAGGEVTVKNQGTDPSGPFAVVGNYNGNRVTQQVSNLNGGESQSFSLKASAGTGGAIHTWCRFSITADANNQVKETNENNNITAKVSLRAR